MTTKHNYAATNRRSMIDSLYLLYVVSSNLISYYVLPPHRTAPFEISPFFQIPPWMRSSSSKSITPTNFQKCISISGIMMQPQFKIEGKQPTSRSLLRKHHHNHFTHLISLILVLKVRSQLVASELTSTLICFSNLTSFNLHYLPLF